MTLNSCNFSHSLPSGYECHTSVITVLTISQHGNDPACWQDNVVSISGLRDIQKSHVGPPFAHPMKMQIFVVWHLKLVCSGGWSCQHQRWLLCVKCLAENKSHHSWWLTLHQSLVGKGQSERLDGGLGYHQLAHCSQISESTSKAARECVFLVLPSLANLG